MDRWAEEHAIGHSPRQLAPLQQAQPLRLAAPAPAQEAGLPEQRLREQLAQRRLSLERRLSAERRRSRYNFASDMEQCACMHLL